MPPQRQHFSESCVRLLQRIWRAAGPVPMWLMLGAMIATAAGAAAGIVLTDEIDSQLPVTVKRALLVSQPTFDPAGATTTGLTSSQRRFASVADDSGSFTAAAEVYEGQSYTVRVPLTNRSQGDLVGQLQLIPPLRASRIVTTVGTTTVVTISVTSTDITIDAKGFGAIDDVVRIAASELVEVTVFPSISGQASTSTNVFIQPQTWKFTADATTTTSGLDLDITVASSVEPGFYDYKGTIKAVAR